MTYLSKGVIRVMGWLKDRKIWIQKDNDSYVVRLELWIDNGKNNKLSNFSNNWRLVHVDEDHIGKRWLQNT
jgi:hypothetical protein